MQRRSFIAALLVLLVCALLLTADTANAQDGWDSGRWSFAQFDKGTKTNPLTSLAPFHVRVTTPTTCTSQCGPFATGGFPVFLFVTSFAAQVDIEAFNQILIGIARHGIVVVAVDQTVGLRLTQDYTKLGSALIKVMHYIRDTSDTGMLADMRGFAGVTGENVLLPGQRIIMGGHTSGVHVFMEYMRQIAALGGTCPDVGGAVLLSPLDGQDPLGFGGKFIISEKSASAESIFAGSTPALMVRTEFDSLSKDSTAGAACVPLNRGGDHFYEGWNPKAAIFDILALGMGPMDMLDEVAETNYDRFCVASNANMTAERSRFRVAVRGAIVTFITGLVDKDARSFNKLGSKNDFEFPAEFRTKGSARGFDCEWSPKDVSTTEELTLGIVLFGIFFGITFLIGLYMFFRKWDADTQGRYIAADMDAVAPTSFRMTGQPQDMVPMLMGGGAPGASQSEVSFGGAPYASAGQLPQHMSTSGKPTSSRVTSVDV